MNCIKCLESETMCEDCKPKFHDSNELWKLACEATNPETALFVEKTKAQGIRLEIINFSPSGVNQT